MQLYQSKTTTHRYTIRLQDSLGVCITSVGDDKATITLGPNAAASARLTRQEAGELSRVLARFAETGDPTDPAMCFNTTMVIPCP